MRRLSILLSVLISVTAAQAQDVLLLEGDVISEADPDRTLISKPGWLRGLHLLGNDLPVTQRPQIEAVIPQDWFGETVCARITTIGGDYSALVQFEIPASMSDPRRRLRFVSAYPDVVAAISPQDSGIVLEKGICIGDTEDTGRAFLASFWNEASVLGATIELVLNMNIARADEILAKAFLVNEGTVNTPLEEECAQINSPNALAYNYRCAVTIPSQELVGRVDGKVRFSYQRVYRGRLSTDRMADIYIGAGQ